jgi:oligopeptide transport system permease protein
MLNVLIRRVLIAIPVLLVVASLTFFFIRLAPGGPFDADKVVSPQVMKNLNAAYNLDAPLYRQYFDYMSGVIVGDFGPSFRYPGRSVSEMIYTGLPITFELAFYALMIAVALGIFSGVLAALKRNTFLDYFPMAIAMLGICVPTFLMGPILVLVFGINLELLPVSGWDTLSGDKLLPSITLGFAYAAYIARLSRGGMLEVLGQDFIRTARAKGLSELRPPAYLLDSTLQYMQHMQSLRLLRVRAYLLIKYPNQKLVIIQDLYQKLKLELGPLKMLEHIFLASQLPLGSNLKKYFFLKQPEHQKIFQAQLQSLKHRMPVQRL